MTGITEGVHLTEELVFVDNRFESFYVISSGRGFLIRIGRPAATNYWPKSSRKGSVTVLNIFFRTIMVK